MGREALVRKPRRCRRNGKTYMATAAQITMIAFVARFEEVSGIEVITNKEQVHDEGN